MKKKTRTNNASYFYATVYTFYVFIGTDRRLNERIKINIDQPRKMYEEYKN